MELRPARLRNWTVLNSGEPLPKPEKVNRRDVLPDSYHIERIITSKKCPIEVRYITIPRLLSGSTFGEHERGNDSLYDNLDKFEVKVFVG